MKEIIMNKIEGVIDYMTQDIVEDITEEEESIETVQDKDAFTEAYLHSVYEILSDEFILDDMLQEIRTRVLNQLQK